MGHPLTLSIVTPSFNTGGYLAAAVQSVLDQDWPNLEFLVMDGGSTDGSLDILRSFGERVRWVSEKDQGQSDAINKGFARTSGDVLTWLNADDTLAPGAARAAMEYFAAHPDVALVYGGADYIDFRGNLIGPCVHIEPFSLHRLIHYSDYIVQPAAFFRRSALAKVGGIDPSLNWAMDYDLWLRLARRYKVAYLPRKLANFRWLKDNKTATGGEARLDEIDRVLAKYGQGSPAFVRLERVNLRVQEARLALRHRKVGQALSQFARANALLLSSPRAMWSMCRPTTWKIIWTGQVLRARAGKEHAAAAASSLRQENANA